MQSSANVQLTPKESVTVSVPANDLLNFSERRLSMVGVTWLSIGNGEEGVPIPSAEEVNPCLF